MELFKDKDIIMLNSIIITIVFAKFHFRLLFSLDVCGQQAKTGKTFAYVNEKLCNENGRVDGPSIIGMEVYMLILVPFRWKVFLFYFQLLFLNITKYCFAAITDSE